MRYRGILFFVLLGVAAFVHGGVWDTTTPLGSEAKSLGDDRIREMKTAIQEALQSGGIFPGAEPSTTPRFYPSISTGTTSERPTGNNAPAGRLFLNISSGTLEMSQGNGSWNQFDLNGSSTITSTDLSVEIAGDGLAGGGGEALRVNVDTHTFEIVNDTITIKADSIGTSYLADAVSFPTSVNSSSYTLGGFGVLPILQIQQYTTATSTNITTLAYGRTHSFGTITPKSSTSKILVMAAGNMALSGTGIGYVTLYRNETDLASSDGGFGLNAAQNNGISIVYYDSPSTTSSTEYSIRIRHNTGSGGTAAYPGTDGGSFTPTATLTLIEIAQ